MLRGIEPVVFFALFFAVAIGVFGLLGVGAPYRLLALIRSLQTRVGLYFVAGLRVLFGIALVLAADQSLLPGFLRILGLVVVIAGAATPLFGLARYRRLLDWWEARGVVFIRCWALCALGFGLGLIYVLIGG